MTQRYGQINMSLNKIKRTYVKKAVPEGITPRHLPSYALLTRGSQMITPTFFVMPQIWLAFSETRYSLIKYVFSDYTSSTRCRHASRLFTHYRRNKKS